MLGTEKDKFNPSAYDVYIIGEQIRAQLSKQGYIKDRRYHLRKYKKCFVGNLVIDWLVKMCHAHSKGEAIMAMRCLQEHGLLHHVVDEHDFKDQGFFYRFTRDDDTYLLRTDLAAFYKGHDLFNKVKESTIRREFYHRGHLYQGAFYGCDLVDILATDADHRADVTKECRELLEYSIIRHVTDDYHFSDDRLMYQFAVDYDRPCLLMDVLYHPSASIAIHSSSDPHNHDESSSSSETTATEESIVPSSLSRKASSSVDQPADGSSVDNNNSLRRVARKSSSSGDEDNIIGNGGMMQTLMYMDKGQDIGGPVKLAKRVVQLHQDEVGYGFVLRGSSPCYIHTIDPLGPAAAAGLKEGQFVLSVGGQNVVQKDHRFVGQLLITHAGSLSIAVLNRTLQSP